MLTLGTPLPSAYPAIGLTPQGDNSPYAAKTTATIVGYGETANGNTSSSGTLEMATVPIQSDQTCAATMPGYDASRMTCAGYPNGGIDTCHGDSGGPLLVNGVEAGITDWGSAKGCAIAGTYSVYERLSTYHDVVTADLTRPSPQNQDFTGDGHSDMIMRDASGTLFDYPGSGFVEDGYGGFTGWVQFGGGFQQYSRLFRVTNWTGNGTESVFAEAPNGNLYRFDTNGVGDWTTGNPVYIGGGFNIYSQIIPAYNWLGDGLPDLLVMTPSGELRLYEGDGAGGWRIGAGDTIGVGFNEYSDLISAGDWRGDGHQALIGKTADGALRLYESNEHLGWVDGGGSTIGVGFNEYSDVFTVGDWSGDDQTDLICVTPGGQMFIYTTDGKGDWLTGSGELINSGWQAATALF